MSVRTIQVLLVDDHPLVRTGLVRILELYDELEVVGAVASGEEALVLCDTTAVDIALIDIKLPGLSGIETIRLLKQRHPEVQAIALTSYEDGQTVMGAMQAGARGYLLKTAEGRQLRQALGTVAAGRTFLMPEATEALVRAVGQPAPPGGDLTAREREVLTLLARGFSNDTIADELVLSRATVKHHVSQILHKLDASSRTEALMLAWRHQLVA
jgi:two-component system, NarL family, response regulator LiaR